MRRSMLALCLIFVAPLAARADITSTFEGLVGPNSYRNTTGPNSTTAASGFFNIDGNKYNNDYSYYPGYGGAYSGWAISSTTDTTTNSDSNQYSAIPGHGSGGSQTYMVGFTYGADADPNHPASTTINLASGVAAKSIDITNTTYSYLAMRDGSQFSNAFTTGDYQRLDIQGFNAAGQSVGDIVVSLADYTGTNHFLLNTWETVDLTSLVGATTLRFGITSSQTGDQGVNTPAYFAADNFVFSPNAGPTVPEPASLVLVGIGLGGLTLMTYGRRRTA